jgi:hypothetical protein
LGTSTRACCPHPYLSGPGRPSWSVSMVCPFGSLNRLMSVNVRGSDGRR